MKFEKTVNLLKKVKELKKNVRYNTIMISTGASRGIINNAVEELNGKLVSDAEGYTVITF